MARQGVADRFVVPPDAFFAPVVERGPLILVDARRRWVTGAPLVEAGATTANAHARVSSTRNLFLRRWHAGIAQWRARTAEIDAGRDPYTNTRIKGDAAVEAAARERAVADLERVWHTAIERGWREGYRIGHAAIAREAPREFSDRFLAEVARQRGFASKFARDLAAGVPLQPGRMGEATRSAMYANGVIGGFNEGAVAASGPEDRIYWRLGVADHCADCPVLAIGSPYTPPGSGKGKELPTTPGSGGTECLTNCKCFLEFVPAGTRRRKAAPGVQTPFVDAIVRGPKAPEGWRLPTADERVVLDDLEARVNHARRRIAQTAGTPEQRKWIKLRRGASERRRQYTEEHRIWDPPKFDVGEVVSGKTATTADVRDLTRVRGIDGRTVRRADVAKRAEALDAERDKLADLLQRLPPEAPGEIPQYDVFGPPKAGDDVPDEDMADLLIKHGAPPELFGRKATEGAGEDLPDPVVLVLNAVGHGVAASVRAHLAALVTLGAGEYDVEVGPFDGPWLPVVMAAGTWISGPPEHVRRFVTDWFERLDTATTPALAPWRA